MQLLGVLVCASDSVFLCWVMSTPKAVLYSACLGVSLLSRCLPEAVSLFVFLYLYCSVSLH
jgi:hypothetical protein